MVSLADPPPSRRCVPRHLTVPAGTRLVRIYNREFLRPNDYNHNGPRGRFDHHANVLAPTFDAVHGIYYAADELAGCIVEVFGDSGVIEYANYGVAEIEVPRAMLLLDLNADGAWLAGSVAALTKHGDRRTTQKWARHFYTDDATYGAIDGLRYENAHDAAQAYVLFERAGPLVVVSDRALSDPALEPELFAAAERLGLIIDV